MKPLLVVAPFALVLSACPPSTLVGQPCEELGETLCEDLTQIRCDGQFYRVLAECSNECVAASKLDVVTHEDAIAADETWTCEEGPHLVRGPLSIGAGTTLTIEAGALVRLELGSSLTADVAGRIDALGVAEAPILFTSNNGLAGGFGSTASGALNVFAVEDGEPSRVEHTIIERGVTGMSVSGLSATATPPVVDGNTFRDNDTFGILLFCSGDNPPVPDFEATNEFFNNTAGTVSSCDGT
jgi:hypothetical protein